MSHVFVRGFDFGTTEQQLRAHFASVGSVGSVEMWGNGACVVALDSPAAAESAVATLNRTVIAGNSRYIDIKLDTRGGAGNGSTPSTHVFIRGFDFGTSMQQLRAHCAGAGNVVSIEMWGQGACVVQFDSADAAQRAATTLHQTVIDGNSRYIDVKIDVKAGASSVPAMATQVFVSGFDYGTTQQQIQRHCSRAGRVASVDMWGNGACVVQFSSHDAAQNAVASLNRTVVDGNSRYIDVKIDLKAGARTDTNGKRPWQAKGGAFSAVACPPAKAPRLAATPWATPSHNGGAGKGANGKPREDPVGSGRVLVRGFDFGTTDEQFMAHMRQAGNVVAVHWVNKGSAVVVYLTRAEAEAAVSFLQRSVIDGNGRYLDVELRDSH